MRREGGFTLIELLLVVVIIGILAAIALPKFASSRDKAYVSSMAADLRNLDVAQEIHYQDPGNSYDYASDVDMLAEFQTSEGVEVVVEEATKSGWSARATHGALTLVECVVHHGSAQPLTTQAGTGPSSLGAILCDPL